MTDTSIQRYRVERRWRNPPPPPYANPWELTWSFSDLDYALECANDENHDWPSWEHRVVDSQEEMAA